MKNVILTHKELQFNIFAAYADGFIKGAKVYPGYFLTYGTEDSFTFEFWKSASAPENGDAKMIFSHSISKGDYQMNDIRIGVTIVHIRENALAFYEKVMRWFENPDNGKPTGNQRIKD